MKNSIKKNVIFSTIYQVFNVLTPFITAPYISRVLGAEKIGIQSYTTSIQSYFLLVAVLGNAYYGAREISINRDKPYERSKIFWEIELLTIFTTLITLVAWCVFISFSSTYRLFYIVLTIGFFASMLDISWFFTGMEEFGVTIFRNTVFKIIGIVCLFVFIKNENDILRYVLITMLTTLISSMSLWPYLKKYLVRVNPKEFRFKNHFRETLVYFVPNIATSIYTVLDRTLLGAMQDVVQVGYYQQAEKIINIAKSVVFVAINSVIGVRVAYLYGEQRFDEIKQKIEYSFNYIFFLGFGSCFGIMGVAKRFVPVFFGDGYAPVIPLLYLFSPIIIIIGISNCLGSQYYTPCGKRAKSAVYLIVGSVVNLILNLLMIPRIGVYGATIASIIAELVITILYVKNCDGYAKVAMLIRVGYKKLISAIGMCFVVVCLDRLDVNSIIVLLIQVAAGAIVYVMLLLIFRDEWLMNLVLNYSAKIIKRVKRDG